MENLKAVFWALLTALIWGSAPVLFKLGLKGEISPLVGILIHNLTATIFALIGVVVLKENVFNYPIKELSMVALGGFVSGFLGLLVYYKAIKVGAVSIVAPVAASSPLFSALLASVILGESLTLTKIVGSLLIIIGIAVLSYSR